MSTQNVPSPPHRQVRINRGDRSPPFLSNVVPGDIAQTTPNGTTFSSGGEPEGVQGAIDIPHWAVPEKEWPGGNRSGE